MTNKVMTCEQIINFLQTYPPELKVYLSLDTLGNKVCPISNMGVGNYYPDDCEYFDLESGENANAICLFPDTAPLFAKEMAEVSYE